MNYYDQYIRDCDYIRGLLEIKEDVSLQELLVKFTAEYKRLNEKSQKEKVCKKSQKKQQSKLLDK